MKTRKRQSTDGKWGLGISLGDSQMGSGIEFLLKFIVLSNVPLLSRAWCFRDLENTPLYLFLLELTERYRWEAEIILYALTVL